MRDTPLVGNAGWIPPVTGVLDLDVTNPRRVVDSNLVGCFHHGLIYPSHHRLM